MSLPSSRRHVMRGGGMPLARHVNFTCTCYETGIIKRSEFVIAHHSNAVLHPNIFRGIKGGERERERETDRQKERARGGKGRGRGRGRERGLRPVSLCKTRTRARGRLSGTMVACARILERKTNPRSREAWKYPARTPSRDTEGFSAVTCTASPFARPDFYRNPRPAPQNSCSTSNSDILDDPLFNNWANPTADTSKGTNSPSDRISILGIRY